MTENLNIQHVIRHAQPVPVADDIALSYTGYFSQTNITAMGEVLRLYLDHNENSSATRRKLFSTFIEMAQNILRYSSDERALPCEQDALRFGSIRVSNSRDKYFLESTNLVKTESSSHLRENLDSLSTMSLEEIKRAWKHGLTAETPATSKGANIGLLTIARDTSEPLVYEFEQVDTATLFTFYLKATICHG